MLEVRANGQHFDAAIQKIPHVAADFQFFRGMLSEIAETNSLDDSGYEVAPSLCRVAHKDTKL